MIASAGVRTWPLYVSISGRPRRICSVEVATGEDRARSRDSRILRDGLESRWEVASSDLGDGLYLECSISVRPKRLSYNMSVSRSHEENNFVQVKVKDKC